MIDDPSFVRSHTTNNHRTSPNLLIKTRTDTDTFPSFSLDSLNYVNGEQTIHDTHASKFTGIGHCTTTCNGLILISHSRHDLSSVIGNPLTGDFHELPQPDVIVPYLWGVGIGYDSRSDDYKVVRIGTIDKKYQAARTLIYSLKSKSWRMIMNCPFDFRGLMSRSVYLNGAVHWISSGGTIVALDLATEEYRELQAAPPPAMEEMDVRMFDAFDGYLVLSDADKNKMGRAWMMRGYGTDEPKWVELCPAMERIVFSGARRGSYPSLLAYSNSERRFIMQHNNRIIRWDIEKRSVKLVTIYGSPSCVSYFEVVPGSLFRFNGGGSTSTAAERTTGAGVKRKRSEEASSNSEVSHHPLKT